MAEANPAKRKEAPSGGWPDDAAEGSRYFCLVRHSQALHNVCDDNLWTPDNPLTPAGERMCEEAREEWGEKVFKDADLIVCSPMMRALQTGYLIAGRPEHDDRWMVSPMCSEKLSGATCDEGRPKSELIKAIPWMATFKGVDELEEEWWTLPRDEEETRATDFIKFLQSRTERRIVVVSHGGFLQYITGFYMQNAEHFVMSTDDAKRSKAALNKSAFNINLALTKEFEATAFKSLTRESIACMQGMGNKKLAVFSKAGGPKTVHGLANWKFTTIAEALCILAPMQEEGVRDVHKEAKSMNINKAFDSEWEGYALSDLLEAPPSAFEGLSAAQDALFKSLGIKTIKDLGTWKYYLWARAICELARFESVDGSS